MTHQPDEIFISDYNDHEFDNLDGKVTSFIYSQADNSIFNHSLHNGPPSPSNESLALNNLNEILNGNFDSIETLSSEHFSVFDEPLFPDAELGESLFPDPFEGPINEITVTTTTSDVENNNSNNTVNTVPSELNSTTAVVEDMTENVPDRMNLKSVDSSIQKNLISVSIQPSMNPRRRYKSEGKRRIKKLRGDLITLNLSMLQRYKLSPNQSLILRLSLITHKDNSLDEVYIHPDELKYYSDKAWKEIDGSICILITQADIDKGEIKLTDLSIIKRKDKMYTFQLIPYSLSILNNQSEPYVIDRKKTISANAKIFREKYNLKASRIACQMLIKENGLYDFTHITCVTNPMIEQKSPPTATKPCKRLVKNKPKSKSTKRKKRSNY